MTGGDMCGPKIDKWSRLIIDKAAKLAPAASFFPLS